MPTLVDLCLDAPEQRLRNYHERVSLYEQRHDIEAQMEVALEAKDASYWSLWSKHQDIQERINRADAMRENLWQAYLDEEAWRHKKPAERNSDHADHR